MSKDKRHSENTSLEEYKNYLEGKLNSGEEHAFERKMLEDDFEADALTGFEQYDSAEISKDLSHLSEKLAIQKSSKKPNYYQLAAVIALFLSFTVALFFVLKPEGTENLTDKQTEKTDGEKETLQEKRPNPVTTQDSSEEPSDQTAEDIQIENEIAQVKPSPVESDDFQSTSNDTQIIISAPANESGAKELRENLAINEIPISKMEPMKETVLEPIPGVNELDRVQSTTLKPAETPYYNQKEVTLPPKLEYHESMDQEPVAQKGDAVSGENLASRSRAAKKLMPEETASGALAADMNETYSPEPQDGFRDFYQYINSNLSGKKWPAVVNVKIKLDQEGKVIDVDVITDLKTEKADVLSQIILSGPVWILNDEDQLFVDNYYEFDIPINQEFRR